jgi:hypothetical protein
LSRISHRGESLIELIVALVILEIVGAAALAAALTVAHIDRHASAGAADDATRWHDYRVAETAPDCVAASAPDTVPLSFPATADRPPLETLIRCGR